MTTKKDFTFFAVPFSKPLFDRSKNHGSESDKRTNSRLRVTYINAAKPQGAKMSKVMYYESDQHEFDAKTTDRINAQMDADLDTMRKTGWPSASIRCNLNNGLYYISSHAKDCNCGMCPVLMTDGTVA